MQVTGIHTYPLKSGRARPLPAAQVEPWGLRGDRRWTVIDADGEKVSARTDPRLFLIDAETSEFDDLDDALRLSVEGHPDLLLDTPQGPVVEVTIHGSPAPAIHAGARADAWIGAVLGREDVSLVWCPDPTVRTLDPEHSEPGDATAYADGFPVLLATEASLRQLNAWVAETARERGQQPTEVPMARFRPNIVIDGEVPFAEDDWSQVIIGEGPDALVLRSNSPCKRCVMTTVDPLSLERGPEPIRTLARHRRGLGGTLFAINLVPAAAGRIALGDRVTVR
ncbi:MOSC domain-containing protein [Naumannella halotolerans]|uniref:MOSC domain-containing protein n=1 Tax=Naumannella halotolerans TaxID=993414 RepID=UPI00370D965E